MGMEHKLLEIEPKQRDDRVRARHLYQIGARDSYRWIKERHKGKRRHSLWARKAIRIRDDLLGWVFEKPFGVSYNWQQWGFTVMNLLEQKRS